MNTKKNLKIPVVLILAAIVFALFVFLAKECVAACQTNYCAGYYSFGLALGAFIIDLLLVLFAMLFWFVSPIGILFILGIKLFFSKNASTIRKNFAMLLQFLALFSWSSAMFILLVVYIDSVSYGVLNLGGDVLNLAIKSGFGFFVFMLILSFLEKKMVFSGQACGGENGNNGSSGDDKNSRDENSFEEEDSNLKKGKKKKGSVKIAGIEFGGVEEKIKNKIKKEIKGIVEKEIDKL